MTDREKVAKEICRNDFGHTFPYRWNMFRDHYLRLADSAIAALRHEAPQDGVAEAAKVLLDIVERRAWTHYLIEMPITIDGKGPATIGEDANSMSYEVWQACDFFAVSDHGSLPDALESWLRALSQGNK